MLMIVDLKELKRYDLSVVAKGICESHQHWKVLAELNISGELSVSRNWLCRFSLPKIYIIIIFLVQILSKENIIPLFIAVF